MGGFQEGHQEGGGEDRLDKGLFPLLGTERMDDALLVRQGIEKGRPVRAREHQVSHGRQHVNFGHAGQPFGGEVTGTTGKQA